MRKLLLASAAVLGFAGTSYAAGLVEINPSTTPPSVGNAGGVPAVGILSAFSAPKTNPDPGNVIVRFSGSVWFDTGFQSTAHNQGRVFTGGVVTGNGKTDAFSDASFFRLYGGVDGKLPNGIIYGANFEMRTIFSGGTPGGYSGITAATVNGSSDSTAQLWYTRRAFTYVGGAAWGIVRLGQGDGAISLLTSPGITTGEAFSTGGWDGDVTDIMSGNAYPGWFYNDTGNEYTPDKVAYLSPTIYGFNFAASFAPNSSSGQPNNGASPAAGSNINQASSTLGSDLSRPRNIIEADVRWQPTFGPVSIDSTFGVQHSGVVNNGNSLSPGIKDKGVDAIDAGAAVTIFGASIYGHVYGGTINGVDTPVAVSPTRGAPKMWTWVAGTMYTNGPWTAGASYYYVNREGSGSGLNNETFRGEAVGGYYAASPNWNIFLEYLHGERHQAGVNFVDTGTGVPAFQGNNVSSNGIVLTNQVDW
jgi:hypothetical protein